MTLIDTNVLFKIQRDVPAAIDWLSGYHGDLALPAEVAWEMLIGSRNRRELECAKRFLSTFDVEEIQPTDSAMARSLVEAHTLSTGLGLADYRIAAQALNRETMLVTFNAKHFGKIAGLQVAAPYAR